MNCNYKFKFYLNGRHSTIIGGKEQPMHPHTWELVLSVKSKSRELIKFKEFEQNVRNYLLEFEEKTFNSLDKFKESSCSTECVGIIIFKELKGYLDDKNILLEKIEISENPTRTFIIEN